MTEQNLYNTPNASLNTQREHVYQPKVFSWNGRLGRLRYLTYILVADIVAFAAIVLALMMMGSSGALTAVGGLIAAVVYVGVTIFALALMKRRLNDFDATGWWMLTMFVPIANFILVILLLFMPGTKSTNRWGPMPAPNKTGAMVGLILGAIVVLGILASIAGPQYLKYVQSMQQMQMDGQMGEPMNGQMIQPNQ